MRVQELLRAKAFCREAVYHFLSALAGGECDLNNTADEIMDFIIDCALFEMAHSKKFKEVETEPEDVIFPVDNLQGQGAA
ncbi:MAG: hypothetical protein IJQ63_00360 [Synergistaceae bacterium]|nr:hypothetical protein [Synergistaceae bacterium]MBQ9581048.1 hypothetical protein [Synergistaceae bacterium]MBQ9895961.1 hypothetical protein [Synergistaceae bacterium]MBR0220205.1 hypothetical protein [Synergistaceae bacterium]